MSKVQKKYLKKISRWRDIFPKLQRAHPSLDTSQSPRWKIKAIGLKSLSQALNNLSQLLLEWTLIFFFTLWHTASSSFYPLRIINSWSLPFFLILITSNLINSRSIFGIGHSYFSFEQDRVYLFRIRYNFLSWFLISYCDCTCVELYFLLYKFYNKDSHIWLFTIGVSFGLKTIVVSMLVDFLWDRLYHSSAGCSLLFVLWSLYETERLYLYNTKAE